MQDQYFKTSLNFWNKVRYLPPEIMGCYPMGSGVPIESLYRHYWEVSNLLPWLPENKFSLFEFCCGAGRWAFALADRVSLYLGIDFSKPQIDFAKEVCKEKNLKHLRFIEGDAFGIDLQDEKFDVIFGGSASMYVSPDNCDEFFRKIKKNINKNGIFVEHITIYIGDDAYIKHNDNYFAIYHTRNQFISAVENVGFQILQDMPTYSPLLNSSDLLRSERLQYFLNWGIKNEPEITFNLMKAYGDKMVEEHGPYIRDAEGRSFEHRFFIFKEKQLPD